MKLFTKIDLFNFYKSHKIKKTDIIFMHGNAGAFAQMEGQNRSEKIDNFWNYTKDYFKEHGSVIVPTFSYSFTKKKIYNKQLTKSLLGFFSETFRALNFTKRTNHPIFSVSFFGNHGDKILKASLNTCFGEKSIFELLYMQNAKLVCLGCSYNELTYTHYLEEKFNVNYRYHKKFSGFININNKKKRIITNYFVRNLDYPIPTKLNLKNLISSMKRKKKYINKPIGKISAHSLNSIDFFNEVKKKLKVNRHFLIS